MNIRSKIIVILLLAWAPASAQKNVIKQATVTVKGTSTLHDWEMTSGSARGEASFVIGQDSRLSEVKNLLLTQQAEDLKSDKEALDKNAYKALDTRKHKTITYQVTRVLDIKGAGNNYTVNTEGKLTIAGNTRTVTIQAVCTTGNGTIRCRGEKALKMTDFKVEPPSLMFGSIKTGDEITVVFDVTFSPDSIVSTN